MNAKIKPLFLILAMISLAGCGHSPKEDPIIEDHVLQFFGAKKVGVLSTTAERREVVFKMPDNLFCAEAPPDVAESLSSSLSLLAQGSATEPKTQLQAEATLQAAKSLATSVRTLFRRTQGAQVFRDGAFNLCQAYLNGFITTPTDYQNRYIELLSLTERLITEELKQTASVKTDESTDDAVAAAAEAKNAALRAEIAASRAEAATKKP